MGNVNIFLISFSSPGSSYLSCFSKSLIWFICKEQAQQQFLKKFIKTDPIWCVKDHCFLLILMVSARLLQWCWQREQTNLCSWKTRTNANDDVMPFAANCTELTIFKHKHYFILNSDVFGALQTMWFYGGEGRQL